MSKQTFWILVAFWSVAVLAMCIWLYFKAKGQDKAEDWEEAIVDDIAYDFRKKYSRDQVKAALDGTRSARPDWQENARTAESLDDVWDEPKGAA